jgi:hypothetical protein
MHPANRFTFHRRPTAPHTTALGFGHALVAAVLAKDQAARLTELGKSGFHTLPHLRLTQDLLRLLLKSLCVVFTVQ